jgi:hypothetical protein
MAIDMEALKRLIETLKPAPTKPLIVNGRYPSSCCQRPTIVVRSREGGFVTQNCSQCGVPKSISEDELPSLTCTRCKVALEAYKAQNYFYRCPACASSWELAKIIPHWSKLFDECGYYVDSDGPGAAYNEFVRPELILARLRHQQA